MWRGFPTSVILILASHCAGIWANQPPVFQQDIDRTVLPESQPVGSTVYTLIGSDPEGASVRYGLVGTDRFQVNPLTGQVTLVKPLDHEVNDTLQFYVTLEDDVNNLVKLPVSVIIIDENDNPPTFKNTPYECTVSEDSEIGATIFTDIAVEDSDLSGETLEVICLEYPQFPNTCEKFGIIAWNSSQQSFNGGISLKEKLNYNEQQFYQLQLFATDGTFNATTALEIKVIDVQDTPPEFQGSLTGVIQEDDPIGSLVMTVHAKDGDKGSPREIVYDLLTNPLDYFLLDSKTGELRTAKPLDREALQESTGVITLRIRARELVDGVPGDDPLTSTTSIASVTIKDVNDEPPTFNQKEYSVRLSENIPLGTPLPNLNMTVSDSDIGINSMFSLRLSDVSGAFAVEPVQGSGSTAVSIRLVNGALDYENPNHRKFIILVIAEETETSPRLSSTATVTVEVIDANDNLPVFDREAYSATVAENAVPGDVVTTITAMDSDTGSFGTKGIVYELIGHGSDMFNVNKKTGSITVAPCSLPGSKNCLDYETREAYYLTYKATDDEGAGTSTVVPLKITLTDSNDNPPIFSSEEYKAIIDEGSAKFEPPLQVLARDVDKTSEINYSIIEGNINNLFSIDSFTGEISVTNKNGLDMTNISTDIIQLTVQASDGIYTANCSVIITVLDVNNNHPIFEQQRYDVSVPEDEKLGTNIEKVKAYDADTGINSQVVYKIEKGGYEKFGIDNITGVVSVISKLDYDTRSSYIISIIAVDGGTPPLTGTTTLMVNIENTNDKIPFFSPPTQRAEVKEDAKVGEVVHKLIAKDHDVNSSEALNFAASEPITAVDKNGKEVLLDFTYKDFFSVDQTTGVVTVARPLQREIAAVVRITVLVTDITAPTIQQGSGTLIISIIDVNDFAPVFLKPWTISDPHYMVELLEGQPQGTVLGTFTATDQDSNIINYAIIPESDYFEINNITGIVKTKAPVDFEKTPKLEFKIIAYDFGVPQLTATANVVVNVININDMDPVFSQAEYKFVVDENAPPGFIIGRVYASDGDAGLAGEITYSLTQESKDFVISTHTGEISVSDRAQLDRETAEEIIIQLVATDKASPEESRSTVVSVHITVNDVNDNPPIFSKHFYSIKIVESISLSPPNPILQLRATDKDSTSKLQYSIISGNIGDVFRLDSSTGIMYPKTSLQNQLPEYSLGVQVSDGIHTDVAQVNVTVQSVNQKKPVFIEPSELNATVSVIENDGMTDAHVLKVKAVDDDTGDNGKVSYHLRVNDQNVQETNEFIINEETGELTAKIPLDRETKSSYQLVLVARDHGPTPLETLKYLTIIIQDVDDNLPAFTNFAIPYEFQVIENLPSHTRVGRVEAIDKDDAENARVYYYMIGGSEGCFLVDRTDGYISTNVSLDREKKDTYDLYIKATNDPDYYASKDKMNLNDLKPSASIAHVRVTVLDENDNPPIFRKSEYNAGVSVSAGAGEFITQMTATDADAGINGSVSYIIAASHLFRAGSNISSGSVVPSPFAISDSGKLTTESLVAEYNQERFRLEIMAKEKAPPFRETYTIVNLWVYEQQQLIRVILSRPPEEVHREKEEIILELSNATRSLVVVDDIKYHVDPLGHIQHDWCDMYLHVVDRKTQTISTIPDVLKVIDAQYDFLKDYYAGFAIENVLPAYIGIREETFEPALAALIALLIVLFVGCVSVVVVCCCFRHCVVSEPMDLKQSDMLIKKTVIDDLNTTENPLWIEQKLKLYEEQELTMQVFCEPESNQIPTQATLERRDSADMSVVDNTYATIQHPHRRGSLNTMLSLGAGDYATLGGSVLPLDNVSSHSQQMLEAALGFQGSTFQVPESTDLFRTRSELRVNKDGQPEFVSELI